MFYQDFNAVFNGSHVYVKPYKEPKVWGIDGIGEYWYGAEEGEKSSTAVVGKDAFSLYKIIETMIDSGYEKLLDDKKDVELASQEVVHSKPGSSEIAGALEKLKAAKRGLDVFYNRQYVETGDVVPIPSGTLHAPGPGVEVVEPQISGLTQSLEDGATYPVRYAWRYLL